MVWKKIVLPVYTWIIVTTMVGLIAVFSTPANLGPLFP